MSRVGRNPIAIPKGVTVTVDPANVVTIKGPKGELKEVVDRDIKIEVTDTGVFSTGPRETFVLFPLLN